jgi:hypothetical protein
VHLVLVKRRYLAYNATQQKIRKTHMRYTIPLRCMNNTLRIGLPLDFVQQRRLRAGDQVVFVEEGDIVLLKFVRLSDVVAAAAVPQREPETVAAAAE